MSEALLRSRDALVWNREALELWDSPREVVVPVLAFEPQWFGMDYVPGRYVIEWVGGVVGFNASFWGLNHFSPSGLRRHGVQILTTLEEVWVPTSMLGRLDWHEQPQIFTEEAARAAVAARPQLEFEHAGGPIGMVVYDNPYTDNRLGAVPVRFRLRRV